MKCLWCFKTEIDVTFIKKAHTIPKSLGGQKYNNNVCDECNKYFGEKGDDKYSIEEALKETFVISRKMLYNPKDGKRKIGEFKSRFFEIKERKGRKRLIIKQSFRFNRQFQQRLCRNFKRGLYKMYFEELNRQKGVGYDNKYDIIRNFARYDRGDLPVIYFERSFGAMILFKREAETPILFFDRMEYLFSNKTFDEIEFLSHVFGFPIGDFNENDFENYMHKSIEIKDGLFKNALIIKSLLDIDFTLKVMND
ncbi:HNH endonuclease [Aquimarina sp. 2201CG14-23]|uniref:HNH endonuclease n=1 Tax=Aquimarina mycalae TaxID=3040073 RepID=UPI002477DEEC|nr:HNH endonuclease [Aquimarina sp. 2201CG14-23]MDH7444517.1 HNH endonuclease [Aquimarina sp. 2201CG14-23]